MAKFPNYIDVEVAEDVTAKVTPIRLGWDKAPEVIALLSEALEEGELFKIGRNVGLVIEALTRSLSENHTPEEVRSVVGSMAVIYSPGSPWMCACMALVGMDAGVLKREDSETEQD